MKDTKAELEAMRLEMGNQGVQAYIAPMGDNHQVTLVLCYHTVLGIHIFTSLPHKAILSVLSVCLSVQTTGVLLASWSVQITTYWLLFGFVGYCGFVGYIVCSAWGC